MQKDMKQAITDRVEKFIAPFLAKNGFNLILCQYVNEDNYWHLRLFIDLDSEEKEKREKIFQETEESEFPQNQDIVKNEFPQNQDTVESELPQNIAKNEKNIFTAGVTINDCAKVSRYLSKWLDKTDFIKEQYTLEVCSKGFMDESPSEADAIM